MILPYSTDAPVYHFPFGTIALVILNTVIFFTVPLDLEAPPDFSDLPPELQDAFAGLVPDEEPDLSLLLEFDQINPVQWITAAFLHADFGHLLGNMFFLWSFGLVVEGKLGWWKFLPLYLLLCVLIHAPLQIGMVLVSPEGAALGASGVIFALLALAVLWAPENDIDFFLWYLVVFRTFSLRIVVVGVIFLLLELLDWWLADFSMSSALGHLAGLVVGIPVGITMLKMKLVDCEGWDLLSRMSR